MDSFWAGFFKEAESIIDVWQEESEEENKKLKKPGLDKSVDPATAAHSYTPDVYWRSWP